MEIPVHNQPSGVIVLHPRTWRNGYPSSKSSVDCSNYTSLTHMNKWKPQFK